MKIPLRDGVKLSATVYKPKEMKEYRTVPHFSPHQEFDTMLCDELAQQLPVVQLLNV